MMDGRALRRMILPLFLEQLLVALVGLADVFVVGFVGEAAVSGVSLVNSFNTIFINLFTALASGGAVVISQYIGRNERENAGRAASQLLAASALLSVGISLVTLAGNASIMRLMYGQVEAEVLSFQGQDLLSLTQRQWRALRGGEISMIFQDSGAMLNPIRTIGGQFVEYIRAHCSLSKADAKARSAQMLGRMGLPNPESLLSSYPFQLSGGQRQRVGIAMAMTFEPKLLLADEPTSALDVTTQAQIIRQMIELRENYHTAILLVTHNLGVAAYAADRILVMRGGQVVDQGRREELLSRGADTYTGQLLRAVPDMGGKRYV